jgi:hypothetical protein
MNKYIIVVIEPGKEPETWGNFKKVCSDRKKKGDKRFVYNTLNKKQMPIKIDDITIYRSIFR